MNNIVVMKRLMIKFMLIATGTYIAYFMIMYLAGLAGIPELRFVNYILYFFITYAALYDLVMVNNVELKYLEGMAFTFTLGALSFLAFGVFVLFFSLFNSFFIDIVGREMQSASQLGIWGPSFIVFAEGLGISSVVSLCMMQYFESFSRSGRKFRLRKANWINLSVSPGSESSGKHAAA